MRIVTISHHWYNAVSGLQYGSQYYYHNYTIQPEDHLLKFSNNMTSQIVHVYVRFRSCSILCIRSKINVLVGHVLAWGKV